VDQLTESIEALPGVSAASAVSQLPLAGSATASGHSLEDFPLGDKDVPPVFLTSFVSPGYLKALGLRLVEGRWLEPTDHQRAGQVAVLSQSIAKKYWPNSSALGHRIRPGRTEEGKWYTIIGVVGDVHHTRLEEEPTGIVYYPMVVLAEDGGIGNNLCLVLRTATVPETLTTPVRSAIWALDPNVPITNVMTLEQLVREARAPLAFSMLLMLVASALALLLGAIGIYGVISFVVSQRTQEIGVRMALGAAPQQVRRMVLLDGLKVAWPGIAIGLAGSFALTRLMRSQLYEVSPLDLQTFVLVPLVLTLVTMLSSLLPARRAARVDPAVALRTE
jgi:predicted permease